MCGNLKDVAIIFIGFFTFGERSLELGVWSAGCFLPPFIHAQFFFVLAGGMAVDPFTITGVGMGLAGSVLYAYIKLKSNSG